MLVSAAYRSDNFSEYILLMPDGAVFLCPSQINRRVQMQDLSPVAFPGSVDDYLACNNAVELDVASSSYNFRVLGLSSNPIKAARFDIGLSQNELAHLTGISKRRIQLLESNRIDLGTIKAKNALVLSDVLGLDPHIFLSTTPT